MSLFDFEEYSRRLYGIERQQPSLYFGLLSTQPPSYSQLFETFIDVRGVQLQPRDTDILGDSIAHRIIASGLLEKRNLGEHERPNGVHIVDYPYKIPSLQFGFTEKTSVEVKVQEFENEINLQFPDELGAPASVVLRLDFRSAVPPAVDIERDRPVEARPMIITGVFDSIEVFRLDFQRETPGQRETLGQRFSSRAARIAVAVYDAAQSICTLSTSRILFATIAAFATTIVSAHLSDTPLPNGVDYIFWVALRRLDVDTEKRDRPFVFRKTPLCIEIVSDARADEPLSAASVDFQRAAASAKMVEEVIGADLLQQMIVDAAAVKNAITPLRRITANAYVALESARTLRDKITKWQQDLKDAVGAEEATIEQIDAAVSRLVDLAQVKKAIDIVVNQYPAEVADLPSALAERAYLALRSRFDFLFRLKAEVFIGSDLEPALKQAKNSDVSAEASAMYRLIGRGDVDQSLAAIDLIQTSRRQNALETLAPRLRELARRIELDNADVARTMEQIESDLSNTLYYQQSIRSKTTDPGTLRDRVQKLRAPVAELLQEYILAAAGSAELVTDQIRKRVDYAARALGFDAGRFEALEKDEQGDIAMEELEKKMEVDEDSQKEYLARELAKIGVRLDAEDARPALLQSSLTPLRAATRRIITGIETASFPRWRITPQQSMQRFAIVLIHLRAVLVYIGELARFYESNGAEEPQLAPRGITPEEEVALQSLDSAFNRAKIESIVDGVRQRITVAKEYAQNLSLPLVDLLNKLSTATDEAALFVDPAKVATTIINGASVVILFAQREIVSRLNARENLLPATALRLLAVPRVVVDIVEYGAQFLAEGAGDGGAANFVGALDALERRVAREAARRLDVAVRGRLVAVDQSLREALQKYEETLARIAVDGDEGYVPLPTEKAIEALGPAAIIGIGGVAGIRAYREAQDFYFSTVVHRLPEKSESILANDFALDQSDRRLIRATVSEIAGRLGAVDLNTISAGAGAIVQSIINKAASNELQENEGNDIARFGALRTMVRYTDEYFRLLSTTPIPAIQQARQQARSVYDLQKAIVSLVQRLYKIDLPETPQQFFEIRPELGPALPNFDDVVGEIDDFRMKVVGARIDDVGFDHLLDQIKQDFITIKSITRLRSLLEQHIAGVDFTQVQLVGIGAARAILESGARLLESVDGMARSVKKYDTSITDAEKSAALEEVSVKKAAFQRDFDEFRADQRSLPPALGTPQFAPVLTTRFAQVRSAVARLLGEGGVEAPAVLVPEGPSAVDVARRKQLILDMEEARGKLTDELTSLSNVLKEASNKKNDLDKKSEEALQQLKVFAETVSKTKMDYENLLLAAGRQVAAIRNDLTANNQLLDNLSREYETRKVEYQTLARATNETTEQIQDLGMNAGSALARANQQNREIKANLQEADQIVENSRQLIEQTQQNVAVVSEAAVQVLQNANFIDTTELQKINEAASLLVQETYAIAVRRQNPIVDVVSSGSRRGQVLAQEARGVCENIPPGALSIVQIADIANQCVIGIETEYSNQYVEALNMQADANPAQPPIENEKNWSLVNSWLSFVIASRVLSSSLRREESKVSKIRDLIKSVGDISILTSRIQSSAKYEPPQFFLSEATLDGIVRSSADYLLAYVSAIFYDISSKSNPDPNLRGIIRSFNTIVSTIQLLATSVKSKVQTGNIETLTQYAGGILAVLRSPELFTPSTQEAITVNREKKSDALIKKRKGAELEQQQNRPRIEE